MGIFERLDRIAAELGDLILPDDVRVHVELGAAYLERGDLDAAIVELKHASEIRPDHPRASYLLGLAHARKGDDSSALEALLRAAGGKTPLAEAHVALGEIYRRGGDLDAAEDSYRTALQAGISDSVLRGEVYRGLGAIYLSTRRLDKSVRELRKAAASLPNDVEAHALLGRALYLRGDLDGARVALAKISDRNATTEITSTLGEIEERQGNRDRAREYFVRAGSSVRAHLGLSRLALAGADFRSAHEQALFALALAPGRPDVLVTLGRVLAATGSFEPALEAFDRALVNQSSPLSNERLLFDRRPVLEEALHLALRGDLISRARVYADAILESRPDQLEALFAKALHGGDLDGAAQLRARAPDAETRKILSQRLAERRQVDQLKDLETTLALAHRHFAENRELFQLSREAGRLSETLDRPLLVTVMGEFNSGKSTFVNALLGEEVAPMGITPTTATINVLKYGAERKGRVVYLDGPSREVAWQEVPALLRGIDADEARRIQMVEVLYPLETLQRVNIVDTPGLNSIHAEHEAIAHRFIAESDAVIWLFTVDQPAKKTEASALTEIRGEGKKILGVLNKMDRADEEDRKAVLEHLRREVGSVLETVVEFSAKRALAGKRSNDADAIAQSNLAELDRALEECFFSRAREIQRASCAKRLASLLDRAREVGNQLLAELSLDAVNEAAAALAKEAAAFRGTFLQQERRRLIEAASQSHQGATREILDFVRPRRSVFGSNEATPADRDFLRGLLEEQLAVILWDSRTRLAEALSAHSIDSDLRLLDEQVYGRFRAFARGYLQGGKLDDFFARTLPKLELNEPEIRRALERLIPWSDELSERELLTPLGAWSATMFERLSASIRNDRQERELARFDLEERVLAPIERFSSALRSFSLGADRLPT